MLRLCIAVCALITLATMTHSQSRDPRTPAHIWHANINARTLYLDQETKDLWVHLHNTVRNATGVKLPQLVWSDRVADVAAGKSADCWYDHFSNQDSPNGHGENIYLSYDNEDQMVSAEQSVKMWWDEIQYVVDDTWDCIPASRGRMSCGHYSQMVWQYTLEVGCAHTYGCHLWNKNWTVVFCEYNPTGNLDTRNPYTVYPPFRSGAFDGDL